MVDPAHWEGLPDGHTRATVVELPTRPAPTTQTPEGAGPGPLADVVAHHRADVPVARRDLAAYQGIAAGEAGA